MYKSITKSISITVQPMYLEEESSPAENHYVWAYHITIANEGNKIVQLINRYWRITDAIGRIQEVQGAGVIGQQPKLGPGERFEYTSGTPLPTPSGIMTGRYEMESETGEVFEVEIPAFSLDSPHQQIHLH